MLARGGTVEDACRRIGVTEQSCYRWRKEYVGLKMDQARRMKELEKKTPDCAGRQPIRADAVFRNTTPAMPVIASTTVTANRPIAYSSFSNASTLSPVWTSWGHNWGHIQMIFLYMF